MTKIQGNPKVSTQVYLEIDFIRDGVIVLKNGEYRAIIETSGVNFFLRSTEEQEALILRYQDFLNSLKNFPIQIVMQSRYLDLNFYISDLRDRIDRQSNPLMSEQTKQYAIFVEQIVEQINVMEKRFFVVVPWSPINLAKVSLVQKIKDIINPSNVVVRNQAEFEKNKMELLQRADQVISALSSLGLKGELMSTQKIIDLFYRSYNPNSSQKQHLRETESLEADVILGKSSMKEKSEVKIFVND